jgi:transcriptional regulator with XRE-family HTH domain
VPYQLLQNCLRTARRRSGLTQDEITFLLGASSSTKVSRHETFDRLPSVSAIFAYEIIFRALARVLFAGAYEEVRRAVIARANCLIQTLSEKPSNPLARHKLKFLQAIVEGEDPQTMA